MKIEQIMPMLVCPSTKSELHLISRSEINVDDYIPVGRTNSHVEAMGITDLMISNSDQTRLYPVVDGFPVLMAPELLLRRADINSVPPVDLHDPRYAEAYEEMTVYNGMCEEMVRKAENSDVTEIIKPMGALVPSGNGDVSTFPRPENLWVDAKHDCISQLEAYDYLAPVADRTFLQLGGSGSHAVKALLAGAKQVFLLTPMIGEAKVAMFLAKFFGVENGLSCVIAVGEELPFCDESIDLIYSGGCFHHMRLDYTAIELHRIMRQGGKFSGVDPWKTPLHTIGTNIIGKREKSVFCKPITPERMQPMYDQFSGMQVSNHGPLLRYFFLALEKLGVDLSIKSMLSIARFDDRVGKALRIHKYGGSLMLAGTK